MNWWQFLIPTVAAASIVRIEAILLGPYWSWIELVPHLPSGREDERTRRKALLRRVALPGVVGLLLAIVWPGVYGVFEGAIIGGSAAGLVLWPMAIYGRPHGLRGWTSWLLYGSFVGAFVASGALGVGLAGVIEDEGGPFEYFKTEGAGLLLVFVLGLFFTGGLERASSVISRHAEQEVR